MSNLVELMERTMKRRLQANQRRKYLLAHEPWILTFDRIWSRCNWKKYERYKRYGGRGIKSLITKDELKQLWFRDNASSMKKPSIDRIDNDGNYTFENCRFIESSENCSRARSRPVYQIKAKGKMIRHKSLTEAAKSLGKVHGKSAICSCLNGRKQTAYGYRWEYAPKAKEVIARKDEV
jgi:hypothetical protein